MSRPLYVKLYTNIYKLCIKLTESDVWTVVLHIVIVIVKVPARAFAMYLHKM